MYLRVGQYLRPFNEANVSVEYSYDKDLRNRITFVNEIWTITGRVILQTNASQRNMTAALNLLRRDFAQPNPDLVFVEDDGVTPTFYKLLASETIMGPVKRSESFPSDSAEVYPTGVPYSVTYEAKKLTGTASRNSIIEFSEQVTEDGGASEYGYVGGALNYAERQRFKQHAPWTAIQSGTAVGLLGRPIVPGPIWPQAVIKRFKPTYESPRIMFPVKQEFRVSWQYEFAWHVPLIGEPHTIF